MIGPLAYIGGKRRLAPQIVSMLPPHVTYVEPFAGGAQVFFHKPRSRVEVLNDLDDDVWNFLRVCQSHAPELIRWLRGAVASRQLFQWFDRQDPASLTDVQRAARFLYLQKNCFGGRRHRRTFHYAVVKPTNYQPARLPALLERTAVRLQGVQLEHLPYQAVLARYDRPTALFYCDPPYHGRSLYQHNFADTDFEHLADTLADLRGTFLLSINDTPATRCIFGRFYHTPVGVTYTSSRLNPRVTESVYSNRPFAPVARAGVSISST